MRGPLNRRLPVRVADGGSRLTRRAAHFIGAKDCTLEINTSEINTSEIIVDLQWHVPMDCSVAFSKGISCSVASSNGCSCL